VDAIELSVRNISVLVFDDARGTTAVEFAIVGPLFIMLVVAIINLCMCLFAIGSLHYAAEEGARCASVRTTTCTGDTTIISYTKSRYFGPGSPTFTYAAAACGKAVTGSLDFGIQLVFDKITVPLRSTACFP
jgi:Flp pilus assembly protein TadG